MDKKRVLLDSIKKLLALNVDEAEIIENMKDSGVSVMEAKRLIAEAKKEKEKKALDELVVAPKPLVGDEIEKDLSSEKSPIELPSFLDEESEEEVPKSLMEEKPVKEKKRVERMPSDMWEKGVITTMNEKIDEIEEIRNDIENIINKKIAKAAARETKKIKVLLEAQRKLMVSEVKKTLDEKEKKLRDLDKTIKLNLNKIEKAKRVDAALLKEIKASFAKAKRKFSEVDARLDKKIELETKITEGILKNAEKKVDSVLTGKDLFFKKKFEEKLKELDRLKRQIHPVEIQKRYDAILAKKVKEIDALIAKKSKELDAQRFDSRIEELKLFQDQFIRVVEKNIKLMQKSKTEIKNEIAKVDSEVKQKLALVDKKMEELTNFEKAFAAEMGIMLEKAAKKKAKKK